MNTSDCKILIDAHYPAPIFKEWHPSEFDMKYHFNTPRRQKKIPIQKAKEDAKLKAIYDKEVAKRQNVFNVIDQIATYPAEIADLFLNTFKWTIEDLVRRHEAFLLKKETMTKEYGEAVISHLESLHYLAYTTKWEQNWTGRGGRRVEVRVEITPERWNEWAARSCFSWSETEKTYVYPFTKVADYTKLLDDYDEYKRLRENDDIAYNGKDAYVSSILHMADTLDRICNDIKRIFGGNKPTKCITDPHWGVDGHFNGCITDGTSKANFLSFGAGGYNIQKFHYRFKITKLK